MTTTESDSDYSNLEKMSFKELLFFINQEDKKVPFCIEKNILQIEALSEAAFQKIQTGGRLFYIGAGTSGRLGVLDAAECFPTFGVKNTIIGIIAGGDIALKQAIEGAEDNIETGWNELQKNNISDKDFVIGLSSSGTTPYVINAIRKCNFNNILTGAITCNKNTILSKEVHFPIEIIVGAEFITGSTRMKSGTAEKLVLNMISTSLMIRLGHIKGNKMVDMQLTNHKLLSRGIRIIQKELNISESDAKDRLLKYGNVRKALENK